MSSDARILYLVRQEVDRALHVVASSHGELKEESDWIRRLDELHVEIHKLATKLAELENRLSVGPAEDTAVQRSPQARKPARVSGS